MTCDEIQAAISAYADGALLTGEEGDMFVHIGTCAACRRFFGSVLDIRSTVVAATPVDVPESLDKRVLAIRPRAARPLAQRRRWLTEIWMRRLSVPLPSAALVALALISITIFSLSLLLKPSEVPLLTLPTVDVYAEHPDAPQHIE
ncbi:MAG TPA: zf-HC2 domain-containing protein [Bacteroidota bacterium]|nr:zf-HC2 domain-containing protein [Bacteroidota bacterium]